jgi:RNA polymerase sigma-70 factor (ECF subfamily)
LTATDDRDLVRAVTSAQDELAFGTLYDRHTPALYRLALRLLGNASDAEDVVHDAWMRAAGGFADFAWRSSLRTWLSGIVVNCARELWRLHGRSDVALHDSPEPGTDDAAIHGTFDRLELERALATLATGYREVLVLHDVEGYTHEEIAGLLSVTTGTSKSQLSRARQALRRALARAEEA